MERLTVGALVVIDVHARDVVTLLIDQGILTESDFEWLSQLRYYLENDEVNISYPLYEDRLETARHTVIS